jgi:hypothetical protein
MAVRNVDREPRLAAALKALDERSRAVRAQATLIERQRSDRRLKVFDSTKPVAVIATVAAIRAGLGLGAAARQSGNTYYGGGGTQCAWEDAWLPSGKRVLEAEVGDPLLVLAGEGESYRDHEVIALRVGRQPCVRIITKSGATLTCSTTTPLTVRRERKLHPIPVLEGLGEHVAVLDKRSFRWEPIEAIEERGDLNVRLIFCNHATFAAGDQQARFIFTHNAKPLGPD